jgi:hypothetical protein
VPADTDVELVVSASVTEVIEGGIRVEVNATCEGVKVLGMAKATLRL